MTAPLSPTAALAEFARRCFVDGSWLGCDIAGDAAQEWGVELGRLVEEKYDPAIHKLADEETEAEPGETWFVFSDWFKAAIKEGKP